MGTSISTLRSDGPLELTPAAGLAGGLWLEWPLLGELRFQPELNYVTAGAIGEGSAGDVFANPADPDQRVRLRFTYTYLQLPVLVAWEPSLRRTLTPRLFAGPYVAFKQDAYVRLEDDVPGASEIDTEVRDRDYGIAFGGQVSVETGTLGRLALGAEASVGLQDVRESDFRTTNLCVLLFVGLMF